MLPKLATFFLPTTVMQVLGLNRPTDQIETSLGSSLIESKALAGKLNRVGEGVSFDGEALGRLGRLQGG
jgi:hypothetical protein